MVIPGVVLNWIDHREEPARTNASFAKANPATGVELCRVARSQRDDVALAVGVCVSTQPGWAELTPVQRGELLHDLAMMLKARRTEMADVVALETGKSPREALAETDGAVALGLFMAGEGRRFYGRTTTSAVPGKSALTVRQPVGVAGLIIAANTPIANVAWKVFPALMCGNTAVLKAAEDTPATAWYFAQLTREAGLPPGVLNVVQGYGEEAGAALVADPRVGIISFTGSTSVGREIGRVAGERLAKVFLELGGKNPLVVCDDADLENAAKWVLLSAFSNAGQRCASGSRVIVFESIYEEFRAMLVERTQRLRVGPTDDDAFGPVINQRQLDEMLAALDRARAEGAVCLTGGHRLTDPDHAGGFYLAPTWVEPSSPLAEISQTELFGPIGCLYRVKGFAESVEMANASPYGLTACIHTKNVNRALIFTQKVQAGVAVVNAGTYGSEPHMPFGGVKQSGNGWREPGTEALDVYSDWKTIYLNAEAGLV